MSSTVPTASNSSSSSKSNTSMTTTSASSSDFTQEQWLELLRVLPASSLANLQLAWKQFIEEAASQRNPDQKTPLPDASTLVRAVAPQDDMAQNTYGKIRFDALLKHQLDLDRKTLDHPNGLDALAAAALGNTNAETNVTSTSAVTVLHSKSMPGTSMVAIPITSQIAPALLGGFKSDSSQRQSPTIRETPKRLAATRAEAEQATAARVGSNDAVKRSRLSTDGSGDDMDISTALSQISTGSGNLLLSNGALTTSATLKPDPEGVNPAFAFQTGGQDISGNWNLHSSSSVNAPASTSSGVTTENNRRHTRDEGITEDEAARREKRRERNRVAAAKCRQNRQNQIEDLKARRKLMEDEGNQIRQQIENVKQQKMQLEELLKTHAINGCPMAQQYYQDGSIILSLSVAAAVAAAAGIRQSVPTSLNPPTMAPTPASIRILQPASTHQLLSNPTLPPSTSIKPEAPSSSPPLTFVPAQRPSTLSLVTPTKVELPTPTLDSAAASTTANQLAARMWSPSIAAKIKTPGGESWVNSQIGLPPISVGADKDGNVSTTVTTTTALLSTPDILHHLGVSVGSTSVSNNSTKTPSVDEKIPNTVASTAANTSTTSSSSNIS
ncbi:hypothetical protein Aperf_G00000019394 [Anoplocephala perfoliata]